MVLHNMYCTASYISLPVSNPTHNNGVCRFRAIFRASHWLLAYWRMADGRFPSVHELQHACLLEGLCGTEPRHQSKKDRAAALIDGTHDSVCSATCRSITKCSTVLYRNLLPPTGLNKNEIRVFQSLTCSIKQNRPTPYQIYF
jgi:hypothetical protein